MRKSGKNRINLPAFLGTIIILVGLFGCGGGDPWPKVGYVRVNMINQSDKEIHMWLPPSDVTEPEAIDPDNKLKPGAGRFYETNVLFSDKSDIRTIKVSMGKNGQTLQTVDQFASVDQQSKNYGYFTAIYSSSGVLTVKPRFIWE